MIDLNSISEEQALYLVEHKLSDESLFLAAKKRACERLKAGEELTSVESAHKYLRQVVRDRNREHFVVLFLDNQHHVLDDGKHEVNTVLELETLFSGTIDGASVHPREIIRRCLELSANAILICHNHPSGNCQPSDADKRITLRLKQALELINVRLLDHFVITEEHQWSFAEAGLL